MRGALRRAETVLSEGHPRVFVITAMTHRRIAPRAVPEAVRSQLVATRRLCARASKPRARISCCRTDTNIVTTHVATASTAPTHATCRGTPLSGQIAERRNYFERLVSTLAVPNASLSLDPVDESWRGANIKVTSPSRRWGVARPSKRTAGRRSTKSGAAGSR